MFRRARIAVLLYVMLFVAAGQYLTAARSTDWDSTLWVDVYPLSDGSRTASDYVAKLDLDELKGVERFFAREARRHGVALEQPFRLNLAPPIAGPLPVLASGASLLDTIGWSLRMRWLATRLQWNSTRPRADIVVFAIYHDGAATPVLDRSLAIEKGLIAVANLFAARAARGSNQVVLAHELLHTLGASDKYAPGTNLPRVPDGLAAPTAQPLYPQAQAELMAGRIAVDATTAETPDGLDAVVIGPMTAAEIGWPPSR